MGSVATSDHTALGDVVNKTFRLESATKELACDLAVGEGTYDFLAKATASDTFFQRRTVELKGYSEPTTVYTAHLASLVGLRDALETCSPLPS